MLWSMISLLLLVAPRETAASMARDKSPEVRAAAAPLLADSDTSVALAELWLLSRDADTDVRLAALDAVRRHCASERRLRCRQLFVWFLADADPEVSFGARDLLLDVDPDLALAGAPFAYRRDAVATLVSRAERHGFAAYLRGLELLTEDTDALVRESARQALDAVTP